MTALKNEQEVATNLVAWTDIKRNVFSITDLQKMLDCCKFSVDLGILITTRFSMTGVKKIITDGCGKFSVEFSN